MNDRVKKVAETVDRMTLRERLFLFAAVLTVMAGAWEALLAAPLDAREKIAMEKVESLRQRLDALNQSLAVTAEGMSEGVAYLLR